MASLDVDEVLFAFEESFDEFRRNLRDDCIAIAPQEFHSAGKPINQHGSSELKTPRFSVTTGDEDVLGPFRTNSANAACRGN